MKNTMNTCCVVHILLLLLLPLSVKSNPSAFGEVGIKCIESERQALLKIKDGLIDNYGHLSSWGDQENKRECCMWPGIQCNSLTGQVDTLNLSHLNLKFPYQVGRNISNLKSFDLGNIEFLHAINLDSLSLLSSLKHLDLSGNNLSEAIDWLCVVIELPSLKTLLLRDCSIRDMHLGSSFSCINYPSSSFSASLEVLDLSMNMFSPLIFQWLFKIGNKIVHLDLSSNPLQGSVPDSFGDAMLSLEYLNMTSCGLRGGIPKSMGNICSLRTLNMYYNNLTGELSEFIGNLSGCTRNSLEVLLLNENQLSGSFPHNITEFSSLKVLDLSANQLTGALPNLAPSFSSLRELHLVGNRFSGNPANSFSDLLHLESLDVAYNSFKGIITEAHLSNLPQLKYLFLSQLSLETSSDWIPPFQLHLISLQSCKLGPMFPKWIRTQRNFFYLDISNAGISDTIPTWLWDLSPIRLLNLSHNHISGKLPADLWTTFSRNCRVIDLSFNDLEGTLPPLLLSNLTILTLSKNRFSGSLSSLCKIIGDNRLSALDISDNLLSGEIPNCHHTQYQNLSHLNFANNNLSGEIPSFVGTLSNLLHLDLHNNSLSGKLPPSMKNCSHLNVLDLGNNRFFGNIPSWIGESLLSLKFLILRSNEFYGEIPLQMCQLTNIKVLDLSMNKIIGIIPKCFSHFSNMAQKGNLTYYNPYSLADVGVFHSYVCPHFYGGNVIVISEGIRQYEYGRNRELLRIIDLSSNKLTGKIPSQLSNLLALQTLNLSRNSLTGTIPPRIGFLKELLSLDLSRNYLTGEIPSSMADLNFLNHLDLSYNNLSGKIPSATQVQSFNASQFLGNTLLCGLPLLQKCPGDKTIEQSQPTKNGGAGTVSEDEDEFDKWFYTGMGVGFAVGFWVICGSLVLKRSWRHAYFLLMINIKDWVYVKIAVHWARLWRSFQS